MSKILQCVASRSTKIKQFCNLPLRLCNGALTQFSRAHGLMMMMMMLNSRCGRDGRLSSRDGITGRCMAERAPPREKIIMAE